MQNPASAWTFERGLPPPEVRAILCSSRARRDAVPWGSPRLGGVAEWVESFDPLFFMEKRIRTVDDMTRQDVIAQVEELLRPIAARYGLETVEIALSGEAHRAVLRVLMDRLEGGITVEECARVSEALSRQLDLYDLFEHPYTLEVSSPGLDRPLRNDADFRRFAGKKAELRTYGPVDGQRHFRGILLGVIGDAVVLQLDGRQVQVPKNQIAQARLLVEMDDLRADLDA